TRAEPSRPSGRFRHGRYRSVTFRPGRGTVGPGPPPGRAPRCVRRVSSPRPGRTTPCRATRAGDPPGEPWLPRGEDRTGLAGTGPGISSPSPTANPAGAGEVLVTPPAPGRHRAP